jgi:hypothetical protein
MNTISVTPGPAVRQMTGNGGPASQNNIHNTECRPRHPNNNHRTAR